MEKLYVLYDPKCEICLRLKDWILVQRSWMGIAVLEAGSDKAKRLFPELEQIATQDDLAVVLVQDNDEGAVYLNDHAWIMVLYAMVEYREWAARLTHPLLMLAQCRRTTRQHRPCGSSCNENRNDDHNENHDDKRNGNEHDHVETSRHGTGGGYAAQNL